MRFPKDESIASVEQSARSGVCWKWCSKWFCSKLAYTTYASCNPSGSKPFCISGPVNDTEFFYRPLTYIPTECKYGHNNLVNYSCYAISAAQFFGKNTKLKVIFQVLIW